MSARSWKQLDAELAGAAPTLAYAPTPRAHLRVVIFRQIDTLLSRLVKLVKASAPEIERNHLVSAPIYHVCIGGRVCF